MDFLELAKKRYSCRKFSKRKVDKNLMEQIINAGIAAPTAVNTQPFKIFHLESEEAKKILREHTDYTFGADQFLMVGYKETDAWVRSFDNRSFADVDASIAATHLMMEIYDLGLATTWVAHFDAPKLKEIFPEMKGYELIALFPIGYAAEGVDATSSTQHTIRKSKEELVETL